MTEKVKNLIHCLFLANNLNKIHPKYPTGIKRHYLYILYIIDSINDSVRITDIAENMLVSSPNITAWVNEMEKLGLVKRQPSPKDKRVSHVSITQAGHELLQDYYYDYLAIIDEKLNISPEDQDTTIKTLHALENVLSESKAILDQRNIE